MTHQPTKAQVISTKLVNRIGDGLSARAALAEMIGDDAMEAFVDELYYELRGEDDEAQDARERLTKAVVAYAS